MKHEPPDLKKLTPEQKDDLILELWAIVQVQAEQIQTLQKRVAELEARLNEPPKNSGNSSVPPSKEFKANTKPDNNKAERTGPRKGKRRTQRGRASS